MENKKLKAEKNQLIYIFLGHKMLVHKLIIFRILSANQNSFILLSFCFRPIAVLDMITNNINLCIIIFCASLFWYAFFQRKQKTGKAHRPNLREECNHMENSKKKSEKNENK